MRFCQRLTMSSGYAIFIGTLFLLSATCTRDTSPRKEANTRDDTGMPLHLGMTRQEVEEVCKMVESGYIMVNSAQLAPSFLANLPSGVAATIVFNKAGRLCIIRIDDPSFRIQSVGPGSSYSSVLKSFPQASLHPEIGFAVYLETSDGISFGFHMPTAGDPNSHGVRADEKVEWVQFRAPDCPGSRR